MAMAFPRPYHLNMDSHDIKSMSETNRVVTIRK